MSLVMAVRKDHLPRPNVEELEGSLDLNRIHFLGRIPHPQLMAVLQASWVHVYLSYPSFLAGA